MNASGGFYSDQDYKIKYRFAFWPVRMNDRKLVWLGIYCKVIYFEEGNPSYRYVYRTKYLDI